ncbi:hypothetical protein [Agromyces lapidis]|uniref:Uncharacterized protein n=1 Tax=Agromyces lapidis TaxID=279574 RepID=A0ABV5SLQ0_9MICO|nr:hypothetical protein [Agromyces lapidis]
MNGQLHCEYAVADFDATVVETCDARLIRVTGHGLAPSSGWRLELVAANPGVVPHPESLWLEVRETPPAEPRPRVLSEVPVEAIIEDLQAREIVVRFRWREGFRLPLRERVPSFR